jgi:serine protease Do/serine protease DegQ
MHTNSRYLAILLLSGALAATVPLPVWSAWPLGGDGQPMTTLAPMLKKAMPAVVNISTKTKIQAAENPLMQDPFFRYFFDLPNVPRQQRESSSLGSGVIVDAHSGFIITNNHVIDKADEITVTLHDGQQRKAKLVGSDPVTDVAVIKVEPNNLTELPIADSSQLQVGDFVVAIGNPFGLGQTVTSGIISALGRSGLGIEGLEDFIQTDASINPGNSGGALVNLRGELIGINTAILAPSGGNVGIGFAIPSNMAVNIKKTLVEHGEIRRGLLGVNIQDLTAELGQAFGISQTQGAVITGIQAGSPADKAGLEPGDIVLAVNGKKIKNAMDVRNAVGMAQVGDEVEVDILRKGLSLTKTAEIKEPKLTQEDGKRIHAKLTGTLLVNSLPGEEPSGVRIEKLHSASLAFQAGLRPGDVIVGANRQEVSTLSELKGAVGGAKDLLLNVQRGEAAFFVMLR